MGGAEAGIFDYLPSSLANATFPKKFGEAGDAWPRGGGGGGGGDVAGAM